MQDTNMYRRSLLSLLTLILILIKDGLNYLNILPVRSAANTFVSLFVVAPAFIVGMYCAFSVVKYYVIRCRQERRVMMNKMILFSLPMFLWVCCMVGMMVVLIARHEVDMISSFL